MCFFKQKTAYEMRISDWSSDVCSSDLHLLNCGYGRGFSVLEVLDAVDRVTNMPIKRTLEPRRAGDPAALISDNRAILATFPWEPRYADLDLIVRHALAWERQLGARSEEHTSELQSLMRISYAVFCLKKKKKQLYNSRIKL